ncbi:MlaD family protein [Nocardia huaxiensis]|uniref:MlaD family protein n=1 Tax=Nocardia huaxiensis TaxID=2755382 RepID=UPI001E41DA0B|nr:MlaD family protein [Nocardia huaxiensis]UFS98541.1 MlaD family protein [Nocardia huaxiensis]
MIARLLGSRGFLSVAMVLVLAAVSVLVYQLWPRPAMRAYCADMPDAIGLFEGSDVTIMGVPVGRVTGIESHGATARVRFELPAARTLPADVGATTLSETLIADRKLAVLGAEPSGPGWNPGTCITKTATPKSMSETFDALAQLADQLNGGGDPQAPSLINRGLAAAQRLSDGTGDQINTVIHRLATALNAPDAGIGHIGALIDALSALARSGAAHWPEIEDMLIRVAQTLDDVNTIAVPPVVAILDKLVDILPALNEMTVMLGGPLLRRLDSVENLPQLISAGVAGLRDVVTMIPSIATAFGTAVDPATQAATLAYAPPRVAIPESDAAQVCTALNALAPASCSDASNGLTHIRLAPLILGSVGAR